MSTHPRVRLDCLASTIESGFPCSKSKLVETGLLHLRPFNIGSNGQLCLDEEYRVPFEIAPLSKNFLHTGDLLFNNTNSPALVGKVAVISDDLEAGFSNHLTRIRVDTTRCEPAFVAAHIRQLWLHGYFRDNCTQWVSQAGFGPRLLAGVRIPLPSLDEQRKIVGILNRAARIERLRAQAQERLREFIPALFVKMFGDPAINPMGWPVATLGELSTLGPQYGANARSRPYTNDQPRYIRITDIRDDGSLSTERVGVELTGLERYRLHEHDLLFARSGATVGKPYIHRLSDGLCVFAGYLIRFRLDKSRIAPEFAFAFTQTQAYLSWIASKRRTAAQPNINGQEYASLKVPIPPIHRQEQFAKIVEVAQVANLDMRDYVHAASTLSLAFMSRLLGNAA